MKKEIHIYKANGEKEIFDPQKLRESLTRSHATTNIIEKIVSHIESEVKDEMTTREIYTHAFELLKREDRKAGARYSLRKAVLELGPSGFPFEQFVSQIFIAKGFNTETGVQMLGECVYHEVDVVAWNEDKLIIVEAKFHNEINSKSDLKVVLYVKERFDDLSNSLFDYGKKRKIDESWLVTNTKFTSQAIQYAECKNMKLVGWNYPKDNSLEDMIADTGLHPITCLTTTSKQEEKSMIDAGIVLCKQAKDNQDILRQIGISNEKIREMIEEINEIQGS